MLEFLILMALGFWLLIALRVCRHQKGGCGGDCTRCAGCGKSAENHKKPL